MVTLTRHNFALYCLSWSFLSNKFDVVLTVHRRQYVEIKCQLDEKEVFIADLIACSTCFGHHKIIFYTTLKTENTNSTKTYKISFYTTLKTENTNSTKITKLVFTRHLRPRTQIPQNLQNYFLHFYSTKYHRQQPLYNTLELLMMGIVMPETC